MGLSVKDIAGALKLETVVVEQLAKYLYPNKVLFTHDEALVLRNYYYKFGMGYVDMAQFSVRCFSDGMGSIGQLFPTVSHSSRRRQPYSGWSGLAKAFSQTGNDLRFGIMASLHPSQTGLGRRIRRKRLREVLEKEND